MFILRACYDINTDLFGVAWLIKMSSLAQTKAFHYLLILFCLLLVITSLNGSEFG